MNRQNFNSSDKTVYVDTDNKGKRPETRVLSTKIPLEDYLAYKIFVDNMFDGSMSAMTKTALKHELHANAVNDKKLLPFL